MGEIGQVGSVRPVAKLRLYEFVRRGRELRVPTESSAAHPAEDEGQSLARQRVDPPFDFQNFVYIFFLLKNLRVLNRFPHFLELQLFIIFEL